MYQVLVLLRAWALWEGRRNIAKALIALFVVYVATCVTLFTYAIVLGGCEYIIVLLNHVLLTSNPADYAYIIPDIVGTCISIIPSTSSTILNLP
jgi:hypothetical protein